MRRWALISLLLIIVTAGIILFKIFYLDYDPFDVIPEKGYRLTLEITTVNRRNRSVEITTFVPQDSTKQQVYREESISDAFRFRVMKVNGNKQAQWRGENVSGVNKIKYISRIKSVKVKYLFTNDTVVPGGYPESLQAYLKRSDLIQVDSKAIKRKMEVLTGDKYTLYEKIRAIHDFIVKDIRYVNFSGGLDADSTLQLLEASCNGKSRLYVAMVRQLGIPARVVGGIILNRSPKKTTHQWVEIYLNGHWVPFCPTNNYFAELPRRYITLYTGDEVLFRYTSKIGFKYRFSFEKVNIPKPGLSLKYRDLPVNIFAVLENFEKFNISLNILIYLLMLPLGALVSVILRNIIGFQTFGIFLPILVASVLKGTGILLGLMTFSGIIFLVFFINFAVTKLELLYHPKMSILLSGVILSILVLFLTGIAFKNYELINVVFFPVAIIAITVNRVMTIIEDEGSMKLLSVTLNTLVVIVICFYFMNSTFLQLAMLSFPELILLLAGFNILIGRWSGIRFTEFIRFYPVFKKGIRDEQ